MFVIQPAVANKKSSSKEALEKQVNDFKFSRNKVLIKAI